jgi:hypothetical protein
LQGPPKFTQIDIFGLKIYHLATLADRLGAVKIFPRIKVLENFRGA